MGLIFIFQVIHPNWSVDKNGNVQLMVELVDITSNIECDYEVRTVIDDLYLNVSLL